METRPTTILIPSTTPDWGLEAWQYLPVTANNSGRFPVVIMAHGFGCNKKMGLKEYAEAFVSKGYAVLLFDYRRWGGSGGSPRNVLLVNEQLEDYRTVISHARRSDSFDPKKIVLWGSSFSGGHVIEIASKDHEIAATISQCPFTDGVASALALNMLGGLKMLPLAIYDLIKQALGGEPHYVPCAAPVGGFGMLSEEGTYSSMFQLEKTPGDFPNTIQASALFQFPFYRPGKSGKFIKCPMLICMPEADNLCPAAATKSFADSVSKGEYVGLRGGHFDCYPGFSEHEKSLEVQLEFLAKAVPLS
ncbi:alpha/beta-hydrolase [Ceratobasidium sp. AG-I]|nr:alpha/beta-hydrolase [Ceratobasidium sp. AG-I]